MNEVSKTTLGLIMSGLALGLVLAITDGAMARDVYGLRNTPPLKHRIVLMDRSGLFTDSELLRFNNELQATVWENGVNDWSRTWGKLFVRMNRTLNRLMGRQLEQPVG